jgi:hypothetical protein
MPRRLEKHIERDPDLLLHLLAAGRVVQPLEEHDDHGGQVVHEDVQRVANHGYGRGVSTTRWTVRNQITV